MFMKLVKQIYIFYNLVNGFLEFRIFILSLEFGSKRKERNLVYVIDLYKFF